MKPHVQQSASLDRDLRDVAVVLKHRDYRVHLAEIAYWYGAISAAELETVCIANDLRVLDDLTTTVGRKAWSILARWLPNDEVQN